MITEIVAASSLGTALGTALGNVLGSILINIASSLTYDRMKNSVQKLTDKKINKCFNELDQKYKDYEFYDNTIIEIMQEAEFASKLQNIFFENYKDCELCEQKKLDFKQWILMRYRDKKQYWQTNTYENIDLELDLFLIDLFLAIETFRDDMLSNAEKAMLSILSDIIKSSNQKTVDVIEETIEKYSLNIQTIEQFETSLKSQTKYNIDLEFFDYKDNIFRNEFINKLDNCTQDIYLKSECKYESLYYALYILMTNDYEDVMIINDHETWIKLSDLWQNKIFVANFNTDQEVLPISKNINIFISDKTKDDNINLEERTLYETFQALMKVGIDHNTANEILKDTNNHFSKIRRKIFKGINLKPSWYNRNEEIMKILILINTFTNSENDAEIIKKYFNVTFEELENLIKSVDQNDPICVLKYNSYNKLYRILDNTEAFEWLTERLTDSLINKYLEFAEDILKKNFEEESEYIYLKEGVMHTLTYISNVYNKKYAREIDNLVHEYIQYVRMKNTNDIIKNSNNLKEISPKSIFEFVYNDFNSDDKVIISFFNNELNYSEKNKIDELCKTLLYFMTIKAYAIDSYKILVELLLKVGNYENIVSIFSTILDPRCNCVYFTIEDKKQLFNYTLEKFLENDNKQLYLQFINKVCSLEDKYIYFPIQIKVIEEIENQKLKNQDCYDLIAKYIKISIEKTRDINVILIYLKKNYLNIQDLPIILENKFISLINNLDNDDEKFEIYLSICKKISRHNFFKKSRWSMVEEQLEYLIKLKDKIVFDNEYYKYLYLFKGNNSYEILLAPVPYKSQLDYNEKNKNDLYRKQKEVLEEIITNNEDQTVLFISKCDTHFYTDIGTMIDEIKKIDLLKSEYINEISNFTVIISSILRNNINSEPNNQKDLWSKIDALDINDRFKAQLLQAFTFDFIKSLTLEQSIENFFWESQFPYQLIKLSDNNEGYKRYIYQKLIAFNCYKTCLIYILESKKFDVNEMIDFLLVNSNAFIKSDSKENYLFEEYFNEIYNGIENIKNINDLFELEYKFIKVLEWKVPNLAKCYANNAKKFIDDIFKNVPYEEYSYLYYSSNFDCFVKMILKELKDDIDKFRDFLDYIFSYTDENAKFSVSKCGVLFIKNYLLDEEIDNLNHETCIMLEKIIDDKELSSSLYSSIFNSRVSLTEEDELELSKLYLCYYENLKFECSKIAKVFYNISEYYKNSLKASKKAAIRNW